MANGPKHPMIIFSQILITVGVLAFPTLSDASSFSFTSGGTSGTGLNNWVYRSDGGIAVTVRGWSLYNLSDATFQRGQIKIWSTGMGLCNEGEISNCSYPNHTVDNSGRYDFLAFSFSESVLLDQAKLTAWANDFDATIWGGSDSLELSGRTLTSAGLSGTGIEDSFGPNNASNGDIRILDLASSFSDPVDWLLISASINYTSPYDSFKFKALTVNTPPPGSEVPEPTTAVLLGTGLIGVLAARPFMKRRHG